MSLLLDLISRGGWVMYPILATSLAGLGLVIERIWALKRSRVIPMPFLSSISQLLDNKQYKDVAFLCQDGGTAAARLVRSGLKMASQPRAVFKDAMEEIGRRESNNLHAHLGALYLVASISPLLGLLGTVTGMINAFHSIASDGMGNSGLLAGGISEALLTTASGLCVAIPALVAHRALLSRADALTHALEDLGADLLNSLAAPDHAGVGR